MLGEETVTIDIDPKRSRERMVRDEILARGVTSGPVIAAMRKTPRHLFVEQALRPKAYADHPLPIGYGQTISQPYVVALMTELLEVRPGMRVLEIGCGSGYQTAILAEMGAAVFSVERVPELFAAARERLASMGYGRVHMKLGDGTLGWPEEAPFDRILAAAGSPSVPAPLLAQLGDPGILVMPVGSRAGQVLAVARKSESQVSVEKRCGVKFVDLVGRFGWRPL